MSQGSSKQQALRYAADVARLFQQVKSDQRRLRRIAEAGLSLAASRSAEELSARLCRGAVEVLRFPAAAVYLARAGRLARLGSSPDQTIFSASAPAARLLAEEKGARTEAAPTGLLRTPGSATLAPLRGRERVIGLLVGLGPARELEVTGSTLPFMELLANQAGLLLENLHIDERRSVRLARSALASSKAPPPGDVGVLGESEAMQQVLGLVRKLAPVDSTVLLTGETGTGKSLVARTIHRAGPRRDGPFVSINCGAIPEALVESELFGHEAGAFTGAKRAHKGKVEQADKGTLFLDEVGEMPLLVQTKLLTFIEERCYSRVGAEETRQANVRILAATNLDLASAVASGAFREDLYYRLNVFSIELPPLRARGEDVLALARLLGEQVAERYGLERPSLGPEAESRLLAYDWPGNVRELRNVMERAVVLSEGEQISPSLLPGEGGGPTATLLAEASNEEQPERPSAPVERFRFDPDTRFSAAKQELIEEWEAGYVRALLEHTGGNLSAASRLVGMDKKNLRKKVHRYDVDLEGIRARE